MNISNQLTVLRIILAFVCIGLILQNTFASMFLAFFVFIIASITDYFDGYFARKMNLISDLGKILDPIADKILIIGVFLAFLQLGEINVWMVAAIMLREFIVTSLRFFCLNKGVVLEAKTLGKHKTVSQIAGAIIIFLTLILQKKFSASPAVLFMHDRLIPLVMWYIVIITVFSGMHYLWVNRKLIKTF